MVDFALGASRFFRGLAGIAHLKPHLQLDPVEFWTPEADRQVSCAVAVTVVVNAKNSSTVESAQLALPTPIQAVTWTTLQDQLRGLK